MTIELTSIKRNPLFNRQEVEFKVEQAATPSRSNVRIGVAVALKADLNRVYVRNIETKSGTHLTIGTAHVYDDSAQALNVEPKYIIDRNQKAEKKVEEDVSAESVEEDKEDE